MKNWLFLITLFVFTNKINAQTQLNIVGKWKIIFINMGIQHDYKTKETVLSKELEALKKSDKEEDKFAFAFSTALIETFEDLIYIFNANGQYEEFVKGKAPKKGTYKLDLEKKTIIMVSTNKFGTEFKEQMNFEIKNNTLILSTPKGDQNPGFTFEKVD